MQLVNYEGVAKYFSQDYFSRQSIICYCNDGNRLESKPS